MFGRNAETGPAQILIPSAISFKGDDLIRRDLFFKNCKPAMIHSRKTDQKINANKQALRREADAIRQALGMGQPAFAGAYAQVA